jgi:hypothetical protein
MAWRDALRAKLTLRPVQIPKRLAESRDIDDIEQSGLFDAKWYVEHAPDAAQSGLDPLDHYLTIGWRQGYSPGPRFDTTWYLGRNNGIAAAQLEPLLHFIRAGRHEGRSPQQPADALFDSFQSLGADCEFAFVQRHFGSDNLNLLRFASGPLKGLVTALEQRFAALLAPQSWQIDVMDGEYHILVPAYGMRFHTDVPTKFLEAHKILAHEGRRLGYLRRKFLEDLEESAKTFVYKRFESERLSEAAVRPLLDSLRRFGPHRLLWVAMPRRRYPPGTVVDLGDGLMRAHIDRFAVQPDRISYDVWQTLCREAARMRAGGGS